MNPTFDCSPSRTGAALALKWDRDPVLEPRAGDVVPRPRRGRVVVREVVRTFFSPFALKRFVVYRTASGGCFSVSIDRWRAWGGVRP
jgi:hypothetical protein